MKKSVLRKYATLIATVGVNVQKGQEVFIAAELDQPEFVKMVVEECYRAGAKRVVVDWDYQPLTKLHVRWRSQKNLSTLENWEEARWQHYVDEIPCRIYLISEDPDGLRGVNQEKMAKAGQAKYKVIRPYRDQIENKYQWCIAAVPGVAWAKKLFPNLSKAQAVEKLWEAILAASRVDDDPVAAWKAHNEDLARRCAYLNDLGITELEYHSSNGTNFKVGMIEDAEFKGGGENSLLGHFFNPNIPTEECFISPKRGVAEGIEKFNKIGMPALFVMLVIVIIRSLTLPNAVEGLKYMFVPGYAVEAGFIEEAPSVISVLATAGGQMFFSLSLAMGAMVTYGFR